MIVYNLACNNAHRFEGWFASPEDFEHQVREAQIPCPVCGSPDVIRQPSAPYVSTGASERAAPTQVADPQLIEFMRRKYREYILDNTEDVGSRFPEEARRIHYQEVPARSIRGQASRGDVQELRDEGIEVFSLPSTPVPPDQLH